MARCATEQAVQHKCASNNSLLGATTLFGEGTQLATRGLAVCEHVEQLPAISDMSGRRE
jgi:hypothetical protein